MRIGTVPSRAIRYVASAVLASMVLTAACTGVTPPGTVTPVPTVPTGAGTPKAPVRVGGDRAQLVTLLIATSPDFTTLDPAKALTNPDVFVSQAIYENLVLRAADGSVQPLLAESWQPNGDRTQYTFTLRSGVKFHHGKDFAAEDVVYTFKRILDPETGSPARLVLDFIEDVVEVDPLTVRFDLSAPSAILPDLLSMPHTRIVASDKEPDDRTSTAPGTGPFILEHHSAGSRTVLKRNDDYWKEGQPRLNQLTFLSTANLKPRISGLVAGQVHVVFPIEASEAKKLEGNAALDVTEVAASSYVSISMDVTSAPFDNKLVRQALRAAIDREALVREVLEGRGTVANDHPISAADPLYWAGQEVATYDVEAAKALLAQAGFASGVDVTLHTSSVTPGMALIAAAIKEMAEPAGFRIEIEVEPERGYLANVWLKEPFTTATWNERLLDEAMALMYRSDSPWNTSNYDNPQLDDLIKRARSELDEEARKSTYQEIQQILIDDVPTIIPVFTPFFVAMREAVDGLEVHPFYWVIANDAILAK